MRPTKILTLVLIACTYLPASASDKAGWSRAQADTLFEKRWDGDSSRIVLTPSRGEDLPVGQAKMNVLERFQRGLDSVVGPDEVFVDLVATTSDWVAESKNYQIQASEDRMQFVIRDLRGLESRSGKKARDNIELVAEARTLLSRLVGASRGETQAYTVRKLGGEDLEPGTRPGATKPRLVARKVFFQRVVAGVPVMGNAAVVTFSPDGSFRKFWASWQQVDLQASRLDSQLGMDEFVDRATDALFEKDVNLQRDYPISLGTCYRVKRTDDGRSILELRGWASVPTEGPDGPGAGLVIDFSL